MKNIIKLTPLIILLLGCTQKHLSNKIQFQYTQFNIPNNGLPKEFGFYTNSGFVIHNNIKINYLLLNDKELKLMGDTTTLSIDISTLKGTKTFSLFSWRRDLYLLNTSGLIYKIDLPKKNLTFVTNINKHIKVINPDYQLSEYYLNNNFIHVLGKHIIIPLINRKDLHHPYYMFGKYNMVDSSFHFLSPKTNVEFLKYQYGSNNIFSSFGMGDTLIIHYPYSSEIELYSIRLNKKIQTYNLAYNQSKESPKPLKDYTDYELYRYNIESPSFGSIYYNPNKKHFYRFLRLELPRYNSNDEYTIEEDKQNTILVYDKNFNYLGQVFLPEKFYLLNEISITPDGFILSTNFDVKPDSLSFYEINYH